MLNISYLKKYGAWLSKLIGNALQPGLCCISVYPTGLSAALVVREGMALPELKWCKFIPYPHEKDISGALTALVAEFKLENTACSWMLQPQDYTLITTEALSVNQNELHDALRWQVKDYVNLHAEEIVLDYFESPAAAQRGKKSPLEVVVTNKKFLTEIIGKIHASGLVLNFIDIPELALRNITTLMPEDEQGAGLAWLRPKSSSLVLTQKGQINLRRSIEHPLDALFDNKVTETLPAQQEEQLKNLALELQRSLDYYQGQLKQNLPVKLFTTLEQPELFKFLEQQLTLPLAVLDLKTILACPADITAEVLNRNLDIIGGALRQERVDVSAD